MFCKCKKEMMLVILPSRTQGYEAQSTGPPWLICLPLTCAASHAYDSWTHYAPRCRTPLPSSRCHIVVGTCTWVSLLGSFVVLWWSIWSLPGSKLYFTRSCQSWKSLYCFFPSFTFLSACLPACMLVLPGFLPVAQSPQPRPIVCLCTWLPMYCLCVLLLWVLSFSPRHLVKPFVINASRPPASAPGSYKHDHNTGRLQNIHVRGYTCISIYVSLQAGRRCPQRPTGWPPSTVLASPEACYQ